MDIADLATAFSTHDFEKTLPHIAPDVVWDVVGGEPITGIDRVTHLCEITAEALADTTVTVRSVRVVSDGATVVVDTVTHYDDPSDGVTVVASCDFYDHVDGRITAIRSYTVELPA